MSAACLDRSEQLWGELWVSLASVIRCYSVAHGLNRSLQVAIEHDGERILARYGDKWLDLKRNGATVSWEREDGSQGIVELTEAGRLKSNSAEQEMDLAAEAWARELMR